MAGEVIYRGAEPAVIELPGEGRKEVKPGLQYEMSLANAARLLESNPNMWVAGNAETETFRAHKTTGGAYGVVSSSEYGTVGDGVTDDTEAMQEAINATKERELLIPPGIYKITKPLNVPTLSTIRGVNRLTTSLRATGEISLFVLEGSGVAIENLELESTTIQKTKGAAIDCSGGFGSELWLTNLQIGSNWFNGLNLVGNKEIGGIYLRNIWFIAASSAVKKYGNAAIVIGSTTRRTVVVRAHHINVQAATKADMPIAIQCNNCDSVELTDVLLQTAEKGLVVGNADTSAKRSTNVYAKGLIADGCTVGFELSNLFAAEIVGSHAEACGSAGLIIGAEATGIDVSGSAFYSCEGHGIQILGTAIGTRAINITGCSILNNGTNAEANRSGVFIESKGGGVMISGCTIGNSANLGTEIQKVGVWINAECTNVGIIGNRFLKNVTAAIKREASTTGIKTVAEIEAQNQMA